MDKKDWIIAGLVLLIIITVTVLITRHFTKQDVETVFNKRNDSLETANFLLMTETMRLRIDLRDLQQALVINEIGTQQNKVIYRNKVSEIKNQSSNEDYQDVLNYLNSYSK